MATLCVCVMWHPGAVCSTRVYTNTVCLLLHHCLVTWRLLYVMLFTHREQHVYIFNCGAMSLTAHCLPCPFFSGSLTPCLKPSVFFLPLLLLSSLSSLLHPTVFVFSGSFVLSPSSSLSFFSSPSPSPSSSLLLSFCSPSPSLPSLLPLSTLPTSPLLHQT